MTKIGVLAVSDERENVHQGLLPLMEEHTAAIVEALSADGTVEVVRGSEPIHGPRQAVEQAKALRSMDVDGVVFSLPTFGFPRLGVLAAEFLNGPFLLMAQPNSKQPSPAGLLGLGGAMSQLSIEHTRLWEDPRSDRGRAGLLRFSRVACAISRMRGQVLGIVGGRSMGLYPMTASGTDVLLRFGVDVDHVDELEIVRLAAHVDDAQVRKAMSWLEKRVAAIRYDATLTRSRLETQIRHVEALKRLIREHQVDFAGIQCHYEMSSYQVPQCLAICALNDPYDWDGKKVPIASACEAEVDGALTMQILRHLTGGPTCLLDVRYYDRDHGLWVIQNCGSAPSWFAGQSSEPESNLSGTTLCPCVPKFSGGGAHVQLHFCEGDYTLARLHHGPPGYSLLVGEGTCVKPPTDLGGVEPRWPLLTLRMEAGPQVVEDKLQCVHVHAVPGRYAEDLALYGKLMRIPVVRIEEGRK